MDRNTEKHSWRVTVRSLSELADNYDECAKAHEATAEMILAGLTSSATEIRWHRRGGGGGLTAEASALRNRAREWRKIEAAMLDELRSLATAGKIREYNS